jgi:hypothetical protein
VERIKTATRRNNDYNITQQLYLPTYVTSTESTFLTTEFIYLSVSDSNIGTS